MNINRVVMSGNLTRDPELRHTQSGTPVCALRLANNTREKREGEWVDVPNYFDVTVWGNSGEACATHLVKGAPVFVDGRLKWSEYETRDGGKAQKVEIVADNVQFIGGKRDRDEASQYVPPVSDRGAPAADDDIPF